MFDPYAYQTELMAILEAVIESDDLTKDRFFHLVRQHTMPDGNLFSKSKLIYAYRVFTRDGLLDAPEAEVIEKIRMKPVRTLSGVTPVTVLTGPQPCPGACIFCPDEIDMPKSYLREEPGAQRAVQNRFDPYRQVFSRLLAYWNIGHPTDKVEMIVLGGTWSAYPAGYQRWFIKRIFDALNAFDPREAPTSAPETPVSWEALAAAQRANESAEARCVGLVVETRPDCVTPEEVRRLRRLGCTKVQIGFQSLDDEVLVKNRRGHDVAATREAVRLLRGAGFKVQAHWMANLYGSSPAQDVADFARMFEDPDFRPDELKIYPCALLEDTELMALYRRGAWRPYTDAELQEVLVECLARVPPYCRVTRMMRDIPSQYIVDGSTTSNFREVVERTLRAEGIAIDEIRAREVRGAPVDFAALRLDEMRYATSVGDEVFLQFVTGAQKIAGFLRLSLPREPSVMDELGTDAVIREVHVYGQAVELGDAGEGVQHLGLGTRLIERAKQIAAACGSRRLHVISAVGTRAYYRKLGFHDGNLYQYIDV